MADKRRQQLQQWVAERLPADIAVGELEMVSGDASFRRYFRTRTNTGEGGGDKETYIAVDAPPEHEDSHRFVDIARLLGGASVNVPVVKAADYELGFMLLTDFGDELYLAHLLRHQREENDTHIDTLYQDAIASLILIQQGADRERLDPYDRARLHNEMILFDEWFCRGLLQMDLAQDETQIIQQCYRFLEDSALAQAQVAVHRDYHSRNLMVLDRAQFGDRSGPGIVDFQDAVRGPYTYDLVSLLRDCYIRWPEKRVEGWALDYLNRAQAAGIISGIAPADFLRDFDLMGLQRHMKVMGIFCRLAIRDKKSRYLADIPLVVRYFLEVASRYPEMAEFLDWFKHTVLPRASLKLELSN